MDTNFQKYLTALDAYTREVARQVRDNGGIKAQALHTDGPTLPNRMQLESYAAELKVAMDDYIASRVRELLVNRELLG